MTSSWIWYEGTVVVPEPGQGWIVAWDPSGRTGKLWVAVGTVEDFKAGPGVSFEDIWAFHETNGFGAQSEMIEVCEDDGEDGEADLDEDEEGGEVSNAAGCCPNVEAPHEVLAMLFGLGLIGWWRRGRSR
jgi:hypothetical protein